MSNLPTGQDKVRAVRSMFDTIAPTYERVNHLISFGLDQRWRKKSLRKTAFARGAVVLDLATGTGDYARLLQEGGQVVVGVDLSFGMLAAAKTTAPLVQGDALRLPVPDQSIDGVTCGFALRNFVELAPFFAELARVCKPGARIALLDAAQPTNSFVKVGHSLWFGRVVPLIGARFSEASAYQYLPRSLAYLPAPAVMVQMLRDAGFSEVERTSLTFGAAQLLTGARQ